LINRDAVGTVPGMTTIRLAELDDGAACAAIYAPYVRDTPISFEKEPPDEHEMRRRLEKTLTRLPWLVAVESGAVVGYAYASPHHERFAYRFAVDSSVYVAESARGRGLGRRLYRVLFALLERQGFVAAHAGITLPNAASVGLHESFGFEPVGVYRGVGFKLGAWHDVGWWQRPLAPRRDRPAEPRALDALRGDAGFEASFDA
jgi:L-amino acid N-acyltransferase YncA